MFAQNADASGDCFLFICEKLAAKEYRRLRSFRRDGKAQFSTWLRAVVRNLCLDWYRSRYGRKSIFRSIASRGAVDQEIFAAAFQRGKTTHEIWLELGLQGHNLSYSEVESRIEYLRGLLTSRQLWLVSVARLSNETATESQASAAPEIPDASPNPETLTILRETDARVRKALSQLETGDRLLLRLRYLEGLGLADVARLVGLKDAQTADRRIREVIERLRENLADGRLLHGKEKSASV